MIQKTVNQKKYILEILQPEDSNPHLGKTYFYCANHKSSAIEKLRSQIGHTLKTLDLSNFCVVGLELDRSEAKSEVLEYVIGSCHFLQKVSISNLMSKPQYKCYQEVVPSKWSNIKMDGPVQFPYF